MASSLDSASFRAVVGSFATGVTVVTARDGDDDVGITSTAFCSVSLTPALVLVAINSVSYVDEVLARQERFAVSLLGAGQASIASRFAVAGRPSARLLLADLAHHRGEHSAALIVDGAAAAFECVVAGREPGGDHSLVLGAVSRVDYLDEQREPLIHFRGRYRSW